MCTIRWFDNSTNKLESNQCDISFNKLIVYYIIWKIHWSSTKYFRLTFILRVNLIENVLLWEKIKNKKALIFLRKTDSWELKDDQECGDDDKKVKTSKNFFFTWK